MPSRAYPWITASSTARPSSYQSGLSIFDLLRYRQHDHAATLCAFDLLELDGADVRSRPIEERKQHLAWVLRQTHPGIAIDATYAGDGAVVMSMPAHSVARAL